MTYTTMQSDMWDGIAYKLYGSSLAKDKLMQANPKICAYYVFPAGIELSVPLLDERELASSLPPWKQVSG